MGRAVILTVLFTSWMNSIAWAGGPEGMHPKPTAEEKRAEAILRGWRKHEMASVPTMIEAVCARTPILAEGAEELLVSLGPAALPALTRATKNESCDLSSVIANLVCHTGQGVTDLSAMVRSQKFGPTLTALRALSKVAKPVHHTPCGHAKTILAGLLPDLPALLKGPDGDLVYESLSLAEALGPLGKPLVPDLIANLEKSDTAGNMAASALGAIGEGAASAVPALRGLLQKGGKWRQRATQALGGIGAPARPALPEIGALLKQTLPDLCSEKPHYSEADAIATAIGRAMSNIGGSGVEPLVPDLVSAFQTMRGCQLVESSTDAWLKRFGALGKYGTAARQMLVSILDDPDESPNHRRGALAALDRVGTPFGSWWKVRGLRKALARREEIFDRAFRMPPTQIPPPAPPPGRTPREFFLCREEAGLSPVTEPPGSAARPDRANKNPDGPFAACLHRRLCGPDEDAFQATMIACCSAYGHALPWFCAPYPAIAKQ